jgi:putative heme iron utilization protein
VGTLATVATEPSGYPYGSLVTFAMHGADPIFLVSTLATHTKNLVADRRASLMVAEELAADPLANGRVTLVGDCARLATPGAARDAFLTEHPGASYYADFTDFSFFRLEVTSVRYIGGYGRMSWVELDAWRTAEPDPLAPHASDILAHMNRDHADALVAYAKAFTRASDTARAVMTGVDPPSSYLVRHLNRCFENSR